MTIEEEKSQAAVDYFKAVDRLNELRDNKATTEEIAEAKVQEQQAWDNVKRLMPDAFCR